MAKFDWLVFLKARRITYIERGPNVARGNVNISCPFCGDGDPSAHLGISLQGRGWGCWRSRSHRGVRPHRLIQALLKCTYMEAQRIVGDAGSAVPLADSTFGDYVRNKLNPEKSNKEPERLKFPKEIRKLDPDDRSARFFIHYLKQRNYTLAQIEDLVWTYGLRYALSGDFAYRVIFPVRMFEGLVSWTGRAISESVIRYKSLTSDPAKVKPDSPIARRSIKDCIWQLPNLISDPGDTLVLCEGPFDALRVDYLGWEYGIRATCLFSKTISDEQLYCLEDIAPIYKDKILLLDPDASLDVLSTMDRLKFLNFEALRLPTRFEDPAVLKKEDLRVLFGF